MNVEVITLDDDDDNDLISVCSWATQKSSTVCLTNSKQLIASSSSSNNIDDHKDIYHNTHENAFPKVFSNTSTKKEEDKYFDDDDDEDLMQAVSFMVTQQKNNSTFPKQETKDKRVITQTKVTSFFPNKRVKTEVLNDSISDADALAIVKALEELEQNPNLNTQTTSKTSIIGIEDYSFDDYQFKNVELESYNNNASLIRSLSIVDPNLENLDPNPDIHKLFVDFDKIFFDGFLNANALKLDWTKTFNSCAGAFYSHKDGMPTILLSSQLLILRPRKDLVETLLHEMIHAYIYLQRINDNNDHGKVFHFHMNRINRQSGTNITVYHSFHDEVNYLRKYVWRCDGMCRTKRPYNGFVSLATKRKPSRWDNAFRFHQSIGCKGTFVQFSNNFKK